MTKGKYMKVLLTTIITLFLTFEASAFGGSCETYERFEIFAIRNAVLWERVPGISRMWQRKAAYWGHRAIEAGCLTEIVPDISPAPPPARPKVIKQRPLEGDPG